MIYQITVNIAIEAPADATDGQLAGQVSAVLTEHLECNNLIVAWGYAYQGGGYAYAEPVTRPGELADLCDYGDFPERHRAVAR